MYKTDKLSNKLKKIEKFRKQIEQNKSFLGEVEYNKLKRGLMEAELNEMMKRGIEMMRDNTDVLAPMQIKKMELQHKVKASKTKTPKEKRELREQLAKHNQKIKNLKQKEKNLKQSDKGLKTHEIVKTLIDESYQFTILLFKTQKLDDPEEVGKKYITIDGVKYRQINVIRKYSFKGVEKKYIEEYIRKDVNKSNFNKLINVLSRNSKFLKEWEYINQSVDVDMIYLMKPIRNVNVNKKALDLNVKLFDKNNKSLKNKTIDLLNEELRNDMENSVLSSIFINYKLNKKAQSFAQLFNIDLCSYVNDNYRANSCFVTAIVNTFHNAMEVVKKDTQKRIFKSLTYGYVCDIVGINQNNDSLALSIMKSHAFFDRFRLGLDVMNIYGEIVHRYRPEKGLNTHISPSVLRIIVINNHVYEVNKLKEKFSHINTDPEKTSLLGLSVSDRFLFRNMNDNDNDNSKPLITYVTTLDEIKNCIIDKKNDKQKYFKFVYQCDSDLNSLLFDMVKNHKVIPEIKSCVNGKINGLTFNIENKSIYICRSMDNSAPEDCETHLSSSEIYKEYTKQNNLFYDTIAKKEYLSDYPQEVLEVDSMYPMGPISGYFGDHCPQNDNLCAIDMCKAYTSRFTEINKVPVFGYFDSYEKYNGTDEINPYFMYVIKATGIKQNVGNTIIFDKYICRRYGFVLLFAQKNNVKFEIEYVRKYTRLENVDFNSAIQNLWKNEIINDNHKKDIVNKTSGLIEKKANKKAVTKVFHTFEEAQYYQIRLIDENIKSEIVVIDNLTEEIDEDGQKLFVEKRKTTKREYLYLLTIFKERELSEGLRQIKELVYCLMNIRMYELCKKCIENNLNVVGIKTDCVLVKNTELDINKTNIVFEKKLGGLKLELLKKCVNKPLRPIYNKLISLENNSTNHIVLNDEFDTNEIHKVIENYKTVLLRGDAGCGKSNVIKSYAKNKKVVFVVPTRELGASIVRDGFHFVTICELLGLIVDNNTLKTNSENRKFDISSYDLICFDEIYLSNNSMKKRIHKFMLKNPDKIFVATGDQKQNEPIGDDENNNGENIPSDNKKNIFKMFPNVITLKINKRLQNKEDRIKFDQMKRELFNKSIPVVDTLKKYFKTIDKLDDIKTLVNISYSRDKRNKINTLVHKKQKQPKRDIIVIDNVNYYKGLSIRCSSHLKTKKLRLNVNAVYDIIKVNKTNITIKNEFEKVNYTIPTVYLKKHFLLPYCRTGHSVQGITINDPYTVFDVDSPYVSRKWIWTAITRCTQLKNVTIFLNSESEIRNLSYGRNCLYFNTKIDNYKRQDNNAKRKFENENFINLDWIQQKLQENKNCTYCKTPFHKYIEDGKVICNITADRINNALPHHKDNCNLACTSCNVRRGHKSLFDFLNM